MGLNGKSRRAGRAQFKAQAGKGILAELSKTALPSNPQTSG